MMTLAQALKHVTDTLRIAGISDPARDARALIAEAAEINDDRVLIERDQVLQPSQLEQLNRYVERRLAFEPVAKIRGRKQFWGQWFDVNYDVLDPRPETEVLVHEALKLGPVSRVLDIGTGSGAIVISLLLEWKNAKAVATDISQPALDVAASNAAELNISERIAFLESDCFANVEGKFDLIVSNPPYIAASEMADLAPDVRNHEPHIALTDFEDGLSIYREIFRAAPQFLVSGGSIIVEIGPTQGSATKGMAKAAGAKEIFVIPDLDGRDRVVLAKYG